MHVFVYIIGSVIYCQICLSAKDFFFIKRQKLYQSCGLLFLMGSMILGIQSTNNLLFMIRTAVTESKHGSLKSFRNGLHFSLSHLERLDFHYTLTRSRSHVTRFLNAIYKLWRNHYTIALVADKWGCCFNYYLRQHMSSKSINGFLFSPHRGIFY